MKERGRREGERDKERRRGHDERDYKEVGEKGVREIKRDKGEKRQTFLAIKGSVFHLPSCFSSLSAAALHFG